MCIVNKTDVFLWTHTFQSARPSLEELLTGLKSGWQTYSLSYEHNRLWRGDEAMRFVDANVNTSYGGGCPFLGTMSYTSLLPVNGTSALVAYDLRLPSYSGYPSAQAGFTVGVRVTTGD